MVGANLERVSDVLNAESSKQASSDTREAPPDRVHRSQERELSARRQLACGAARTSHSRLSRDKGRAGRAYRIQGKSTLAMLLLGLTNRWKERYFTTGSHSGK